ncbi:unnamed protein product [Rhizophagus irregularis]|nr:unnamed protein product [Rhizophagus irregularis]
MSSIIELSDIEEYNAEDFADVAKIVNKDKDRDDINEDKRRNWFFLELILSLVAFFWKEGRAEWSVNSTKSSTAVANTFLQKIGQKHSTKLSGPRLFGLDIEPLYNFRLQIGSLPITTTATKVNERKRPLEDITSRSQQNKRINRKEVLKPDHQYCICLYVGREKYEDLAKVGQLFQNQLFDLKNNGIIDQDATSRWDMNKTWNNTVNTKCERKSPLFPAINQENYIPDELHLLLLSQFIPDQEIDQFEIDAQNWIRIFCRPTQGRINSPIQIPGLYRKEDVTPYMHVFAKHYRKKNHNQVRLFFGGTTMGGGTDGKSVKH